MSCNKLQFDSRRGSGKLNKAVDISVRKIASNETNRCDDHTTRENN